MQKFKSLLLLAIFTFSFSSSYAQNNQGQFERISVYGVSLEGNLEGDDITRDVSIYLPPSYGQNSTKRYPVVYMLHGFTDTDANWFGLNGEHFVNLQNAVDRAWDNGSKEMIFVMPNALTLYGGSMYSNSATTGDWEGFIAEDLVAFIDKNYRTLAQRESRAIAGHSMGGYGAIRIGMKYPEVFSSLYGLSPCCMSPNMEPALEVMAAAARVKTEDDIANANFGIKAMLASAAAWSSNPLSAPYYDLPVQDGELHLDIVAKWAANAPLTMVHQYIPALKEFTALIIDAGDRDVGINATVHELDAILNSYGVSHISEEYSGDHVSGIGERITNSLMPLFSESLVFE